MDTGNNQSPKKQKEDNNGRHKLFQLELVFINRILEKQVQHYNSILMGFESLKKSHTQNSGKKQKD